ncbi:MAG: geranylgeranyl reductase family protein [Actinomycetia bacterium]|nr:geranylgeranyl reductase family protein [Actinomycetes bacterium]
MSENESTVDVLIVGGGPAGATAAIVLARAGRAVMVVDKAVFPRDKCCGDGLTTLALRELEALGFEPAMVPSWQTVEEAWLRSPSGREVCLPMPPDGIFGATAPRRELDDALLRMAREAGADVREGCAVTGVTQNSDGVEVAIEGIGNVRARFAIAADGMWSPTRKALGLAEPGYLGEWHAFRQYATGITGPAAHRLYVWFEPDFLPGYAWSFPLPDGRVNLGFGVLRDGARTGKSMNAEWASLLERPHIREALGPDAQLQDRVTAWPIPAAIDRATLSAGRVLFVGDAARATDVMTGEGIGQAIVTGRLAAEAILGSAATVASMYEKSVRAHLLADHRLSKVLNGWLARAWIARGAVRVVGLTGWTRRNFARWMFEDEPRAIVFTPRRWHRKFLKQPGPYR